MSAEMISPQEVSPIEAAMDEILAPLHQVPEMPARDYIRQMTDRGFTQEEAVSTLTRNIEIGKILLTNRYRLRSPLFEEED